MLVHLPFDVPSVSRPCLSFFIYLFVYLVFSGTIPDSGFVYLIYIWLNPLLMNVSWALIRLIKVLSYFFIIFSLIALSFFPFINFTYAVSWVPNELLKPMLPLFFSLFPHFFLFWTFRILSLLPGFTSFVCFSIHCSPYFFSPPCYTSSFSLPRHCFMLFGCIFYLFYNLPTTPLRYFSPIHNALSPNIFLNPPFFRATTYLILPFCFISFLSFFIFTFIPLPICFSFPPPFFCWVQQFVRPLFFFSLFKEPFFLLCFCTITPTFQTLKTVSLRTVSLPISFISFHTLFTLI